MNLVAEFRGTGAAGAHTRGPLLRPAPVLRPVGGSRPVDAAAPRRPMAGVFPLRCNRGDGVSAWQPLTRRTFASRTGRSRPPVAPPVAGPRGCHQQLQNVQQWQRGTDPPGGSGDGNIHAPAGVGPDTGQILAIPHIGRSRSPLRRPHYGWTGRLTGAGHLVSMGCAALYAGLMAAMLAAWFLQEGCTRCDGRSWSAHRRPGPRAVGDRAGLAAAPPTTASQQERGRPAEAGRPRGMACGSGGHHPDPPASIPRSALPTSTQRSPQSGSANSRAAAVTDGSCSVAPRPRPVAGHI